MLIATVTAATLSGLIGLARGGSLARLAQLELPPVAKVYGLGDLTASAGVLPIVVHAWYHSREVE